MYWKLSMYLITCFPFKISKSSECFCFSEGTIRVSFTHSTGWYLWPVPRSESPLQKQSHTFGMLLSQSCRSSFADSCRLWCHLVLLALLKAVAGATAAEEARLPALNLYLHLYTYFFYPYPGIHLAWLPELFACVCP